MTPAGARPLRPGLRAGVLFVCWAVAGTLGRPATEPAPPPPPTGSPGQGTTFGELVYLRFREGKESVQVRARAVPGRDGAAMRLEGVELPFPFVTRGEPSRATVTADECLYDPDRQGATFRGHVHVTTEDGFVLDTESLEYRGDEEVATTPGPVRFQRRWTSGTARGLHYRGAGGPGAPGGREARGLRHLRCRRLEVFFRENGALASATAVNRASLVLEPGPGEPRERRRIEAYLLHFTFDGGGRLP